MTDVLGFFHGAVAGSVATFIVMYVWAMTSDIEGD